MGSGSGGGGGSGGLWVVLLEHGERGG